VRYLHAACKTYAYPDALARATSSIKINLTEVRELGQLWSSDTLTRFANDLSATSSSANAGQLEGNMMFYTNDYMVGFLNHVVYSI